MGKDGIDRRQVLAKAGIAGSAIAAYAASAHAARDLPSVSSLEGQSVLITGTSSGFGRLMAEHFARLGAQVFATMRTVPRPEARELQDLARKEKLNLEVIDIDVTSRRSVERGIARAENMAGGALDVLVNNAGIGFAGPVEMQDEVASKLVFDTNLFGPQHAARAALPAMREKGSGLIVNISSILGRVIYPNLIGLYSPTKFALEAMSEAMAYEVAPFGVDVAIIQPAGYPTKIWDNVRKLTGELLERTPEDLREAYASSLDYLENAHGGDTDPMDVPKAVAGLMAMPAGERPLRVPVHPTAKPQLAINEVSAQTQRALLEKQGRSAVARRVLGD